MPSPTEIADAGERALDPDARALVDLIAAAGQPGLEALTPVEVRAASAAMKDVFFADPPAAVIRDLAAPGAAGDIPLRLYRPRDAARDAILPALIYAHGGGWIMGDLAMSDHLCATLVEEAGIAVLAIDYRLAPEAKFPAALDDVLAALAWAVDNAATLGVDPSRLAVGGDSAGGNLAAVAAIHSRDTGRPALRAQILIYPVTDARGPSASYARNAEGYILSAAAMEVFIGHYLRDDAERSDWRVSPLAAERLDGVAPAYIITCGFDPLHDEGAAYAQRLEAAGVPVIHRDYPGQIHGFLSFAKALPSATPAIGEIATELKARLF